LLHDAQLRAQEMIGDARRRGAKLKKTCKSQAQLEIDAYERKERENFDEKMRNTKLDEHNEYDDSTMKSIENMREKYDQEKEKVCQLILEKLCNPKPELMQNFSLMSEYFTNQEANAQCKDSDD
jgi:hypothetical protein